MLLRLKFIPKIQLALFVGFTVVAVAFGYFADFYPRYRLSLENLLWGATAGLTAGIISLLPLILLAFFRPKFFAPVLRSCQDTCRQTSRQAGLGNILLSASAEELLLRAFLFSLLYSISPWLAYLVNGLISFVMYFSRSRRGALALGKSLEATIIASLFSGTKSVAALAFARGISEAILYISLRSKQIDWFSNKK